MTKIGGKINDYKRGWGFIHCMQLMDTVEFESSEEGTNLLP